MRDLLPSYALDALGPIDRLEVRAHLEVCDDCERILRDYHAIASELAFSVPAETPSRELRNSLMTEVSSTTQALPIGVRNGKWRLARGAAVAAAAVVVVIGAMAGLVTSQITAGESLVPEVVSLLSSPDVNAIAMAPTGEDPDASGQLFVPEDARAAAVIITGLDDPGTGTYQLALVLRGQTVRVASFQPDSTGVAVVLVRRNVGSLEGVIVTHQPAGSSGQQTGRLILKSP